MSRRHNHEVPSLIELIDEMGYGWVVTVVRILALFALTVGLYCLVTYVARDGLRSILDHMEK